MKLVERCSHIDGWRVYVLVLLVYYCIPPAVVETLASTDTLGSRRSASTPSGRSVRTKKPKVVNGLPDGNSLGATYIA